MAKIPLVKQNAKPSTKTVLLRVTVPDAREVIFTGSFTGWARDRVRLAKGPSGLWTGTVELAPGEYQYRLLVNGEWRDDSAAEARIPNEFGSFNCILKVAP